ncbi:uncharacterized protein PHACADRAFT_195372 [Phanerochaete carnosa HHB-10118-sp]|uniref:Replication protein A C-terminal domain-containing protein n=1 Tax=Phanerochaete carnosa (strain HHB-10118-sp) TaxID=650164 RepID=K5W8R0_PHACS|nr:uncharacterized protein PHACADRAFT_195372 [Phanerochaete carnosa HHB-10118-sp]EKM55344.1 hypothetical protein PHACADRAFT_195372 [Phanerochaete carnosa HHB-10118-sp]
MSDEGGIDSMDFDRDDNSSTRSNASSKSASLPTLRPVTLRQVLEAKRPWSGNDTVPWYIDGQQIHHILVVASVVAEGFRPESRTAWYRLEDGTNRRTVTVLRYIEDPNDAHILPQGQGFVPKNVYVRVMGHLFADRGGGSPSIRADAFHVVQDPHEPYVHVLRVMYVHMEDQKGAPPQELLRNLTEDDKEPLENISVANGTSSSSTLRAGTSVARPSRPSQAPPVAAPRVEPAAPPPTAEPSMAAPSTPARRPPTSDIEEEPIAKRPAPIFSSSASTASASSSAAASARNPFPTSPRTPRTPTKSSRSSFRPAQSSPFTPNTEHRFRTLSTHDPLSDLTILQRKVLLRIMEATEANFIMGLDVTTLATDLMAEGITNDARDIADGLDHLADAGHIIGDPEGMYYRTADLKGKKPTYTLVPDD